MSWLTDNINRDLTITCGDGSKFTPNYLQASVNRSVEFNTAQFNFKGIKGTKVDRRQPQGAAYDIEIIFQGDNHIVISKNFRDASENPAPWVVSHPTYGSLFVQPLSLKWDDSDLNITRITGAIMETLNSRKLLPTVNPIDVISLKKLSVDSTFAANFITELPTPDIADVIAMSDAAALALRLQKAFVTTTEAAELVRNTYTTANAAIENAFANVSDAVTSLQAMLNLPVGFINKISDRIDYFIDYYNKISNDIAALEVEKPGEKIVYASNAAAVISAMCLTTVTNITDDDYPNRIAVVSVITRLNNTYNNYLANLDAIQTDNGGTPGSYIPNFDCIRALGDIVGFTLTNLFAIALSAKQQRILTLDRDNTIINIAWELYGLVPDDSTITSLIADNALSREELLIIRKGREIIYYPNR